MIREDGHAYVGELVQPFMLARCRDCRAPVVWSVTAAGKRMPLDADPANNGNVLLCRAAEPFPGQLGVLAVTLSGVALDRARAELARLYRSHHMTCPNAANRRKK